MTLLRSLLAVLITVTASAFLSCSLAPPYQRPAAPTPPYLGPEGEAQSQVTLPTWRDFLPEDRLKALVEKALEENRDLKLATLRIREALAEYGVTGSERFPMLEVSGSQTVSGGGGGRRTTEDYEAGLMLPSFELDFFGRINSMTEAARENYLATQAAARYARLALLTSVCGAYLDARLAQERFGLTQRSLESWRSSMAFIEERIISGQAQLLDLEQARAMVAFAEASLALQRVEIAKAQNALKLVLGDFKELTLPSPVPLANWPQVTLPENLPSESLLTRPDILEAEHKLLARNADIGAARAAFFPKISLTGALGFMSMRLASLFDPGSDQWSFSPVVTIPIFSGGRNRANLELSEIRREMAIVEYEMTIQSAFREVAEGLEVRKLISQRLEAQRKYLSAQRRVLDLAANRYQSGVVSYLEVLAAQREVFDAEMTLLEIKREEIFNDLSLYTALGGGFPSDPEENLASPVATPLANQAPNKAAPNN